MIGADAKLTEARINDLLAKAGVDVAVAANGSARRIKSRSTICWPATARKPRPSDFEGTPGFIVGTFRVPGVVEMKVFKQVIADARAAAKKSMIEILERWRDGIQEYIISEFVQRAVAGDSPQDGKHIGRGRGTYSTPHVLGNEV